MYADIKAVQLTISTPTFYFFHNTFYDTFFSFTSFFFLFSLDFLKATNPRLAVKSPQWVHIITIIIIFTIMITWSQKVRSESRREEEGEEQPSPRHNNIPKPGLRPLPLTNGTISRALDFLSRHLPVIINDFIFM